MQLWLLFPWLLLWLTNLLFLLIYHWKRFGWSWRRSPLVLKLFASGRSQSIKLQAGVALGLRSIVAQGRVCNCFKLCRSNTQQRNQKSGMRLLAECTWRNTSLRHTGISWGQKSCRLQSGCLPCALGLGCTRTPARTWSVGKCVR